MSEKHIYQRLSEECYIIDHSSRKFHDTVWNFQRTDADAVFDFENNINTKFFSCNLLMQAKNINITSDGDSIIVMFNVSIKPVNIKYFELK